MPRRSAYRICLPNFCGLAATSVGMPRRRSRSASSLRGRAGVLVGERHEHGARDGAAAGEHAVGDERDERARDAEGDADAG